MQTMTLALACSVAAPIPAAELASVVAKASSDQSNTAFDGVVEAVRQTVVAAQVPGAVVQLLVKTGDHVAAGQVLVRLDSRAADQSAAANDAQVIAARAALEVASKDVERQRQLFARQYISQAALDQAESQFKTTQAQVQAQMAQAGAARTQTSLYVVRAPFAGVIADVPVALGDMAMPGRPLATLYDPAALRVVAAVPQSASTGWTNGQRPRIELPSLPAAQQWLQASAAQLLPTMDPATHTVTVRANLPAGLAGVVPGLYARLWLPLAGSSTATLSASSPLVPRTAIVQRAELTGLYVLDATGKPWLRQVRLGAVSGAQVQVLSGLTAGERVAADAQAAARATAPAAR